MDVTNREILLIILASSSAHLIVIGLLTYAHLVPPLPPNPSIRVQIRGEAFGGFGGLGPLGGVFPPSLGLLAHLGCTPAIGAQWVALLTGKKKKNSFGHLGDIVD